MTTGTACHYRTFESVCPYDRMVSATVFDDGMDCGDDDGLVIG